MQNDFADFLLKYEAKVVELSREANLSYFKASVSGRSEDYKKASELQLKLSLVYSDKKDFELLNKIMASGEISDFRLRRQLTLIFNMYSANQYDEKLHREIVTLSSKIEEQFSTFRANVNGEMLTDNRIDEILETSTDSALLESAWKSSKEIGKEIFEDVLRLVEMRNESARRLGYQNYHTMSLVLSEQSVKDIDEIFDALDDLTSKEFAVLKSQIDARLSKKFSVNETDLMPWHYEDKFFQQGPKIFNVDLDKYFKGKDLVKITQKYFDSIGLNIDDIIERSDLFEKDGKYQHAYCTDIDRRGDIRVLCNVKPNYRWMNTMLHEFGHAVYGKFIDKNLPWVLREHAHIFTTEAVAMMFGRLAADPDWLSEEMGLGETEKRNIEIDCLNSLKLEQLVFSRWVQVMYRFEKAMYENPRQNLNSLWWDLAGKYQLMNKPAERNEPDWASKIHIALYPAYYHNYMLGELLASQLGNVLRSQILTNGGYNKRGFKKQKSLGEFLINEFFSFGAMYHWSELIEKSTGEKLNAKHYALEFVSAENAGQI